MNLAKLFAANRASVIHQKAKVATAKIETKIDELEKTDLPTIKWVWEWTVKALLEQWVGSIKELTELSKKELEALNLNPLSLKSITKFLENNNNK